MDVTYNEGYPCQIDTSLRVLNVTIEETGGGLLKKDISITYDVLASRNISSGSVDYPIVWQGIQWRGTSAPLGALANGTRTRVAVNATGLMRGQYGQADLTTNGFTPDFRGLRVLACMGTLSFSL